MAPCLLNKEEDMATHFSTNNPNRYAGQASGRSSTMAPKEGILSRVTGWLGLKPIANRSAQKGPDSYGQTPYSKAAPARLHKEVIQGKKGVASFNVPDHLLVAFCKELSSPKSTPATTPMRPAAIASRPVSRLQSRS